jgi:ubiquinone/menaquinone biosynthesis C-methylase UbiE
MSFLSILDQMRAEWNGRAKKDAHFYVAFGRQSQAEDDFLASAAEVMPAFEQEFSRLPPSPAAERRALEIGCGPGRLMVQMARHFGEVHGVDISEEMIALGRQRLAAVPGCAPGCHLHVTAGADLAMFANEYFDFVYSYIVFQHIPDREVVLSYLREARRVLKPGGVLRCQIRGTAPLSSEMSRETETWTGCFFNAEEVAQFATENAFPLVDLSGLNTQYMWTTFRKPLAAVAPYLVEKIVVKDVTSARGPERRIPERGSEAAVSIWIDGMPESASLADFDIWFGERRQLGCYLSPVSESGGCQCNARLPEGLAPGDYSVQLKFGERAVEPAHSITIVASPPRAPRVLSVTDGINITSRNRLETGGAKVVIEDVHDPFEYSFTVAGVPAQYLQHECTDPITSTYQFSFRLRAGTPSGHRPLSVAVAGRDLDSIDVEVVH